MIGSESDMTNSNRINDFGSRFVFEFAGMPKSGKSTTLDLVKQALRGLDYRILDFHGGGRYSPIDKAFGGDLNAFLAAQIIAKIAELRSQPRQYAIEIALLDRGILDRIIFTIALRKMEVIDREEQRAICDALSTDRMVSSISGFFVFRTTPDLSLSREAKVQIEPREGRVMNSQMLQALHDATNEALDDFSHRFHRVKLIDTAKCDGSAKESASAIASEILRDIKEASASVA